MPAISEAIDRLDNEVTHLLGLVESGATRTRVFTDLSLTESAQMSASYQRLRTMAIGYATSGSSFAGDTSLLAVLRAGLADLYDLVYGPGHSQFGNWFHWQISSPQALNDACVLLYDQLSATEIDNYTAIVQSRIPNADGQTGANRVDVAQVMIVQGILDKSSTKIAAGRDALSPVFPLVTSGDGFYSDGTFIQHNVIPYTGQYGRVLLEGLASLLALLTGSPWEVIDPQKQVVFDTVEKSFSPFIYDGRMMDALRGRGVSRWNQSEVSDGRTVEEAILLLAASASSAEAAAWRSRVKGWLQRSSSESVYTQASVVRAKAFHNVLHDASVGSVAENNVTQIFPVGARAVHRRPGWCVALASASSRIAHYESINGENRKGWFQGSGMLYRYDSDHAQYSDSFWAAVDPYRLPGTTVQRTSLPPASGAPKPTNKWSGGTVLDGNYGTVAQYLIPPGGTSMRAWKSWHFLSTSVVCLGSKISSSSSATVETILENRNLHHSGSATLTVDGVTRSLTLGSPTVITGASWAHIQGVGGYVLLGGATLYALLEDRAADWSQVNSYVAGAPAPTDRRFLSLWVDHGGAPTAGHYSYVLLPGADVATTANWAASPPVAAQASSDRHIVEVPAAQYLSADVFTVAGTSAAVTTSSLPTMDLPGQCSVIVRRSGSQLKVAVAQPTKALDSVTIVIHEGGWSPSTPHPSVSVSTSSTSTRLTVDTSDRDARSHQITLV
ncbi:polysaccharide lyase 8 family protein [Microbacterium esteraromaticum]|uniref:polysaccharide lyase 8 family protein n=1 Tax=Microbacterium esteraromaticum TaxID=57043 RepID=UPI0015F37908|nr:polysaccharide lyase 8 family protein [Microbacterium esteraromaticum]